MTDSTPRPSPTENHLLITAYTTHPESPLLSVTRRIADSGCNLVDARLSTVGRDVSVTALATGSWDAVAKLEAMLSRLERDDGLKLVRELRSDLPGLRIVVLSMLEAAVYRPKAMQAGANFFVSKLEGPAAIVSALRQPTAAPRSRNAATPHELAALSERELQVFIQLGQGRSTQEIAAALNVSVKTIESHRENIKGKLDLPHANALVARAALWVREQGLAR